MQSKHLLKMMIMLTGLLLCACHRQATYSRFQHVSETGWEKVDTLEFDIPPMAESGTYREALLLRINSTFPFLALTIEVTQTILPEGRQERYTKNCHVIDQKGNIKGAGVSLFQYTFPLNDIQLSQGDSLHISVTHCMKREILPGMNDIGISLTKQ